MSRYSNEGDRLDIEKQIVAKFMRKAARLIRGAKDVRVAEAYMRAAGEQLRALPGALERLTGTGAENAPEITPPQLAEFLKRRRRR